jgi:hypothetical protein
VADYRERCRVLRIEVERLRERVAELELETKGGES